MRLRALNIKNVKYYSIIEDYKRNGKRTTRVLDNIGNEKQIIKLSNNDNLSVEEWLKKYFEDFKNKYTDNEPNEVIIKKYSDKLIPSNKTNNYNVGYLFLKEIYYSLKIDKIVNTISKKYKFEFDLNSVLSNLVFSRIIYPSSKLKTYELCKNFIEVPKHNLENIYRGLTYLNNDLDYIQKEIYNNSKAIIDRNTRIIYFDCTNYYFDINEETDLQKYGVGKDKKPKPLVGMGLFMDGKGLPIAMNIYPGSESETKQLIPLQKKIISNYDLDNKKTIICTDAAMCTDEIKKFNIKDNRAFVITQSIKKLKDEYKKQIFDDNDWRIIDDKYNTYKLSDILNDDTKYHQYYDTIFYKIISTETAHVVQDLIVTFQIKYMEYSKNVRDGQIERAKKKISTIKNGMKIKLSTNPNDYRRLIKESVSENESKNKSETKDPNSLNKDEKKNTYKYSYSINLEAIREEEKYDGYYGITTNLEGEVSDILRISKNRWEIEESFRILKTDFDSGTVYLSREDRIKSHFLTCFISLLIDRILENKLNYKYTNTQIIETIRNMNVYEEKGTGYSPSYIRTELTDDLHSIFGFRTDYEIISYKKFEKIFKDIKR